MLNIFFQFFLLARRAVYLSFLAFDKHLGRSSNLVILSYHSVSKDGDRFSIDPAVMKKQLTLLKKNYEFITLSDVEKFITGKKKLSKPSVVVTIDDGYKDILGMKSFFNKLNIKPTLFILSDTKYANWDELGYKRDFLTNREIASLKKAGWEIGCHSATHANLSTLTEKEIALEVVTAKKELEKALKTKITYFAYPRGKYSKAVLQAVKNAKFKLGLTMDDGVISKQIDPLLLPRIGIDRTHSFTEFQAAFSPTVITGRKFIKNTFIGRLL